MNPFFTRYVPPKKEIGKAVEHDQTLTSDRKRKVPSRPIEDGNHTNGNKKRRTSTETEVNVSSKKNKGQDVLAKYSVIATAARTQNGNISIVPRKKKRASIQQVSDSDSRKKLRRHGDLEDTMSKDVSSESHGLKHSNVLQRYGQSIKLSGLDETQKQEKDSTRMQADSDPPIYHDLVPIPQPEELERPAARPTYSTLPAWQAAVTKVDPSEIINIHTLGLSEQMVKNLRRNGIETVFPVQATLIPLLAGQNSYKGDLCVAAATGSGKTLAYVVPLIENLKNNVGIGLRAVIVVPTRELVRQVKDTCDMCATGTKLQIGTSSGSKSLQEEQQALILEEQIYDPAAYEKEMSSQINWATFNLESFLKKALDPERDKKVGFVTRTKSKVDILITTPGRLVEHIQSTPGFNLDVVKWLVVDEADRLLNESYQNWVHVVVPALKSRRAFERHDKILQQLRLDLPPRIVRKVLLSATMTKQISKLQNIGLENPKLVELDLLPQQDAATSDGAKVDESVDQVVHDHHGTFTLPPSLEETAVIFKDGSDKPLVLLQLIKERLGILLQKSAQLQRQRSTYQSSGDDEHGDTTSSSGTDTSSKSSSDESDSESESDSSSSSSNSDQTRRRKWQLDSRPSGSISSNKTTVTTTPRVLVFTRSTASASRLSRLLALLSPEHAAQIVTLTRSTMSSATSRRSLSTFRSGKTPILIATDRVSRGIDITGLDHVINYDLPGSALTYVHRAGRTARAGKDGHVWTLVEHREGRWFWTELGGKSSNTHIKRSQKVKKIKAKIEDENVQERYKLALQTLGDEVRNA